jgi:plastocyanin
MRNVLFIGCAAALLAAGCGSNNTAPAPGGNVITFSNFQYSPSSLTITAGSSVTFRGSFSSHPLHPMSKTVDCQEDTTDNPIPVQTSGSSDLVVNFPNAGVFPYYCAAHCLSNGMKGTITVTAQ